MLPTNHLAGLPGPALLLIGGIAALMGGFGATASITGSAWGALAATAGAALVAASVRRGRTPSDAVWIAAGAIALACVAFSASSARTFAYLNAGSVRGTWPYLAGGGFLVAHWFGRDPDRRGWILLAAVQLWLVLVFHDATGGALVTSDDLPSFLYRLHLERDAFPHLVFWNPEWNGGYATFELVSTGAIAFYLLTSPFLALLELVDAFSVGLPHVYFVVLPWSYYLGLRAFGVTPGAAALGGIASLAPTTLLFLYALHFGLPPFTISCYFAVVATGFFARAFLVGRTDLAGLVALVAATSFALLWPLGALILLPMVGGVALAARRFRSADWRRASAVAAALLVLHLPWVYWLAIYGDSREHLARQASPILRGVDWRGTALAIGRTLEQLSPVVEAFGPVGAILMLRRPPGPKRSTGALLVALAAWSFVVGILANQIREDVGLERFAIPASLFLAALATVALDRLLEYDASWIRTAILGTVLAGLGASVMVSASFYRNQGVYGYETSTPALERMVDAIRTHCDPERRVLVPGFSLHWFGGGHVAPLPLLTGRSFVGNDFYHRRDSRDAVPREFASGEGFRHFLELWNVGCVLSHRPTWAEALAARPDLAPVANDGGITLYTVPGASNRFLRGSGRVEERLGALVVEAEDPEVVIKYRWSPALGTEPAVPIEAEPIYGDVSFIRLRPGGHRRVEITLR
jgi:hypothetical protein